jgi:hypothetical protein
VEGPPAVKPVNLDLQLSPAGEPLARVVLVQLKERALKTQWRDVRDLAKVLGLLNGALAKALTVWYCARCRAGPFRFEVGSCDACGGEKRRAVVCWCCGSTEVPRLGNVCEDCHDDG